VIISGAMVKKCTGRASHKFSLSFFIIDPFHSTPTQAICVNLFFNECSIYKPSYRVGDILYCRNFRPQMHNNFPQIVGSYEKTTLLHFRKISSSSSTTSSSSSTAKRARIHEEWTVISYTIDRLDHIQQIDPLILDQVNRLHQWSKHYFQTHSLADTIFPHGNIHSYYEIHHRLHQQQTLYSSHLLPSTTASLLFTSSIQQIYDHPEGYSQSKEKFQSIGNTMKCDVVVYVISVMSKSPQQTTTSSSSASSSSSSSEGEKLEKIRPIGTRMELMVWDGSTRGSVCGDQSQIKALLTALETVTKLTQHYQSEQQPFSMKESDWKPMFQMLATLQQQQQQQQQDTSMTSSSSASKLILALGLPLMISTVDDPSYQYVVDCCSSWVGHWIRIKNLSFAMHCSQPVGEIRAETHISRMDEDYLDVQQLVQSYYQRLVNYLQSYQQSSRASLSSSLPIRKGNALVSTGGKGPTPHYKQQQQQQQHTRRTHNQQNHAFTPIAWIMAAPVPSKFCCYGRLIDWYPKNVHE
jgi:hypothetical protein